MIDSFKNRSRLRRFKPCFFVFCVANFFFCMHGGAQDPYSIIDSKEDLAIVFHDLHEFTKRLSESPIFSDETVQSCWADIFDVEPEVIPNQPLRRLSKLISELRFGVAFATMRVESTSLKCLFCAKAIKPRDQQELNQKLKKIEENINEILGKSLPIIGWKEVEVQIKTVGDWIVVCPRNTDFTRLQSAIRGELKNDRSFRSLKKSRSLSVVKSKLHDSSDLSGKADILASSRLYKLLSGGFGKSELYEFL